MKIECHTSRLIRDWGVRRLASRKIRGPSASLGMTQEKGDTKKNLRAKWRPRHFAISTGCSGSPLPKEVWNPRWVPHSIPFPLSPAVLLPTFALRSVAADNGDL